MSDDPGFDEDMDIDEPGTTASDPALEQQLLHAADPEFLQNLVMHADQLIPRCCYVKGTNQVFRWFNPLRTGIAYIYGRIGRLI